MKIERIITLFFSIVGFISVGFILGNVGISGIFASIFFCLCSIVLLGFELNSKKEILK